MDNEDLKFIRNFSKITITKICNKHKINRGNLMSGTTTKENIALVRREIESEYAKLHIIDKEG